MMKQRHLLALCGVICLMGMGAFSPNEIAPFQAMSTHAEELPTYRVCGNDLEWDYDFDTQTLTLTGTGDMVFSGNFGQVPWKDLAIETVVLPDGMTSIAKNAFRDCKTLKEVNIPNTVKTIGENAFMGCESLLEIDIPNSVTTINYDAFKGCSSLQTVTLSKNLKKISGSLFEECTALSSIEIPESVTEIGGHAFRACESLVSVEIPESVKEIAEYTFFGCKNLRNVTLPETIELIGDFAFSECTSLISVKLPTNLKKIGKVCFGISGLESLTIPEGVTDIERGAFVGCVNLTKIDFPESIENIGSGAFGRTPWILAQQEESPFVIVNHLLIDGTSCTGAVVIPETVTSIEEYAFVKAEITSIDIPENVTKIKDFAFQQCPNLTSITVRNLYCQVKDLGISSRDTALTIYGYAHSLVESNATKNKLNFEPLEGEPKANYSYEIIPVVSSFNKYFFVKTDNPDPESFRFADKESAYSQSSTIAMSKVVFSDMEYDDEKTLRIDGGYLFYSNTTDGGEVTLQAQNFDTWVDLGMTSTLPKLYDSAQYLIDTYATKSDFFANMDAVQEGLLENAVYSGSFIRGEIYRRDDFWRVSLSPHIDHHFYIHSPYYYKNNQSLLMSEAYPYCCDSLGFPSMMATVAKRLESTSSYMWNRASHAYIDVTFEGVTKTYGGQGRNEGQAITEEDILYNFNFNEKSLTLKNFHEWLDKYSSLEIEDEIPRENALTWAKVANLSGSGTWAKLDGGYAYLYLKDGKNSYFADEFGVGNSVYWRGSLGYGCDSWVDGRYIDEHEQYIPDATFAEHPESNMILKQTAFPVIDSSNANQIREVSKTVKYVYDVTQDLWKADSDAISSEDYQKIVSMIEKGTLSEKYLHVLQLTPEEVQDLHVDRNTSIPPESGLVFDGTAKPASKFVSNDAVFENGDISQNGTLETEDITIVQKYLHCQNPINEEQAFIADLNLDGKLNVIDLALLKQQLYPDRSFEGNPVAFLRGYLHLRHTITEEQSAKLDGNQDGILNVIDLALLKRNFLSMT